MTDWAILLSLTYEINVQVINGGMPEENNEPADDAPAIKDHLRNKVVNQKGHDLCKTLEMSADQATLVANEIFSIKGCRAKTVLLKGCQTCLKYAKEVFFVKNEHRLSPIVFDNTKQDGVQNFCGCVLVDVKATHTKKRVDMVIER